MLELFAMSRACTSLEDKRLIYVWKGFCHFFLMRSKRGNWIYRKTSFYVYKFVYVIWEKMNEVKLLWTLDRWMISEIWKTWNWLHKIIYRERWTVFNWFFSSLLNLFFNVHALQRMSIESPITCKVTSIKGIAQVRWHIKLADVAHNQKRHRKLPVARRNLKNIYQIFEKRSDERERQS